MGKNKNKNSFTTTTGGDLKPVVVTNKTLTTPTTSTTTSTTTSKPATTSYKPVAPLLQKGNKVKVTDLVNVDNVKSLVAESSKSMRQDTNFKYCTVLKISVQADDINKEVYEIGKLVGAIPTTLKYAEILDSQRQTLEDRVLDYLEDLASELDYLTLDDLKGHFEFDFAVDDHIYLFYQEPVLPYSI